jgi:dehydrogenase/reductase SDR family protein 7B
MCSYCPVLGHQRIWITGASSGIGRAMALSAIASGARVVLSARRRDVLEAVRAESGRPDAVRIVTLDQSDLDASAAAARDACAAFGGLDVVVLNGGISQRSLALDTSVAVDRQLITVNYLANVAMIKAILPVLVAQPTAQIAVVSSLVGVIGSPYRSGYAASKHALHGFFDSLRAELPEHVSITMLCPGFVRTDVSVNALTGDGSPLGQMDQAQAHGLSPDRFAEQAWAAIAARKREVYIAGPERRAIWLHRFAPGILAKMLRSARVR